MVGEITGRFIYLVFSLFLLSRSGGCGKIPKPYERRLSKGPIGSLASITTLGLIESVPHEPPHSAVGQ